MSKAFLKEDADNEPVVVPPRAPLPPGVPNYVTPRGLKLLQDEQAALSAEYDRLQAGSGDENQRRLALVSEQLEELNHRVSSAVPVEPTARPDVQFGATVTVQPVNGGEERRLTLVGADEADITQGLVAFTAPIAQALTGKRVGEVARLKTAKGEQELRVISVEYR